MSDALDLLEHRLAPRQQVSESIPAKAAEEWHKDFAEVLRHELNNPLTRILDNAELLLAEIARKKDGKAPVWRPGAGRDDRGAGYENARNGKAVEPRMGNEKRPAAPDLSDQPKRDRMLLHTPPSARCTLSNNERFLPASSSIAGSKLRTGIAQIRGGTFLRR